MPHQGIAYCHMFQLTVSGMPNMLQCSHPTFESVFKTLAFLLRQLAWAPNAALTCSQLFI